MRIVVMGAGAIGSAVGGFMSLAGHDVVLIGRKPHMDAIAAHGLRITGIWGEHLAGKLTVCTDPAALRLDGVDWVFVTVKSYDTPEAVRAIAHLVGQDTLVCAYQNGLGNAEIIADTFGWARTVGARAIYGVKVCAPGWIDITVIAQPTALGVYDSEAPAHRVRAMADLMNASGIPTEYTEEIATVLWAKVAYNCALNPLSALLDVPYGRLLDTEHTRIMMQEVVEELYKVAACMALPLKPATAQEYTQLLFERLIPPTAAHYASMREDLLLGRRTEIDALNGAIWRMGMRHGVVCPTNALLTRLVHAREELHARKTGSITV